MGANDFKSQIRIVEQEYSRLAQLAKENSSCSKSSDNGKLESISLVAARFKIALDLVHEFGHALINAGIGQRPNNLCYMSSPTAEAGFEVEMHLSGYILDVEEGGTWQIPTDYPICCHSLDGLPIPSKLFARSRASRYTVEDAAEHNDLSMWSGCPIPFGDLVARFSLDFVAELFTNSFWDDYAREARGLIPPIVGWNLASIPDVAEASD